MKKAIALLLALALVGGAVFAQAGVGVYLEGEILVLDQDQASNFDTKYGTITLKGSNDTAGFGITYEHNTDAGDNAYSLASARDWNVYYKLFDGKAQVNIGKLRNGTYRMGSVYEKSYMSGPSYTDRIVDNGMLIDLMLVDGLKLGVNLPFGMAAETADVFQKMDIGATYAIGDVANLIFMANLDLVAEKNIINFGFNLKAVENLAARLLFKATLEDAKNIMAFNASAKYTMDALSVGAEFVGANRDADLVVAAVVTQPEGFNWKAFGKVGYTLNDNIAFGGEVSYASVAELLDVNANATYDFGNGLETTLKAGYADDLYYNWTVFYSISL